MAKQKRKKRTKQSNTEKILRYSIWILSILATLIAIFLGGYYLGYTSAKEEFQKQIQQQKQETQKTQHQLTNLQNKQQTLKKQLQKFLQYEQDKHFISAAHEIEDKKVLPPKIIQPSHTISHKPKLAIIFDDVSTRSQVRAIHRLGLKVTLSFFPPSPTHPNTAKLAKNEPFYMVHLPMEALHFHKEEPFTLHTYDSYTTIQKRIQQIKQLFPKVHYINNHTGSKFTSNYHAMKNLLKIFQKENIQFIDSRTTSQTKVKQIAQELSIPYIARDVFLDHNDSISAIKKQIKLAIKLAKKYGKIIAIGHPHPHTLQALAQSKNLLKQVDLVYVYQIN